METLDAPTCWALLRQAEVGRLAVSIQNRPDIFPINHVVDHGSIVFRTAEGTKLAGTIGKDVAYEVDGVEAGGAVAWSVIIKGEAHEVAKLHESIASLDLPLFPWHRGPKPHIVRIDPYDVQGRRFAVTLTRDRTPAPRASEEE